MKAQPTTLAMRRRHERENLAWAREHLARWNAAGRPEPDALVQLAQRIMERLGSPQEPQPSLFTGGQRDE